MANVITRPYSDIDILAGELSKLGKMGRSMAPSWKQARHVIPVCSPNGEYLGKILPGVGLLMSMDTKEFGITKPIPHVLNRTPVMKMVDFFKSERKGVAAAALVTAAMLTPSHIAKMFAPAMAMAITTYDSIINARANGLAYDVTTIKVSFTTVTSAWSSSWQAGGSSGTGTYVGIPGGSVHVNSTTGSWSLGIPNPTGGNKAYILTLGYMGVQGLSTMMVHDLLVAAGGIDANSTGLQTVNSTALTRYTNGIGVQFIFDITTALGATPSNISAIYTNQSGTGSRAPAAQALLASGITQRLTPVGLAPVFQLVAGDYGVRSVESVQLSAGMGSGALALNLYYPLAFLPGISANAYIERDSTVQIDGLCELAQSSGAVLGCLNVYVIVANTVSGIITGFVRSCQG